MRRLAGVVLAGVLATIGAGEAVASQKVLLSVEVGSEDALTRSFARVFANDGIIKFCSGDCPTVRVRTVQTTDADHFRYQVEFLKVRPAVSIFGDCAVKDLKPCARRARRLTNAKAQELFG